MAEKLHLTRARVGRKTWKQWVDKVQATNDGSIFCTNGDPKQVQPVRSSIDALFVIQLNDLFMLPQLPFGKQVNSRIGVQHSALTMRLPAYTNEQFHCDVTYFPCLNFTEDSNTLITALFLQLQLHHKRTQRWPQTIYIAVDSKSTNQSYVFVSAIVELVQLATHLEIERAFILFSEPGHHIMKIEHMHSRLQIWLNSRQLVDSVGVFASNLDNRTENGAHFSVQPISWIYAFDRRYKSCIDTVTKVKAKLTSRRLVEITKHQVILYSEPTTDLTYSEDLGLQGIENETCVIDKWFSEPVQSPAPLWREPDMPSRASLQQLRRVTRDCTSLDDMIQFMVLNEGRLSHQPELTLFWCKHPETSDPHAFVEPSSSSSSSNGKRTPSKSKSRAPFKRVSNEASISSSPAPLPPIFPERFSRFILIACNNKFWTCYVLTYNPKSGDICLRTTNPPYAGETWRAVIEKQYENTLTHPDGWTWLSGSQAALYSKLDPLPCPWRTPLEN